MKLNGTKNQNSVLKAYNLLLYFAGSMIMYEPTNECVNDFWSKGILKSLPVKSSNPRFMVAASQLRESCADKAVCAAMLKEDFDKLLSSTGKCLALPVKSNYFDAIMQKASGEEMVSDFYNSYGWKKRTRYNIPDDHLGIELLFLTLLIDKYIVLDDHVCQIEMGKEIRRFIKVHVLSWLPEWNALIQQCADSLCYKGIATLIYASCEDIFNIFGDTRPEIIYPTEFKN